MTTRTNTIPAQNAPRAVINGFRRALTVHAAHAPRGKQASWKQCRYLGRLMANTSMTLAGIGLDKASSPLTYDHAKAWITRLSSGAAVAPAKPAPARDPAAKVVPLHPPKAETAIAKCKPAKPAAPCKPAPAPACDNEIVWHSAPRVIRMRGGPQVEWTCQAGNVQLDYSYYRKALNVTARKLDGTGRGTPLESYVLALGRDGKPVEPRTNKYRNKTAAEARAREHAPGYAAYAVRRFVERAAEHAAKQEREANAIANAVTVEADGDTYTIIYATNNARDAYRIQCGKLASNGRWENGTYIVATVDGSLEDARAHLAEYLERRRAAKAEQAVRGAKVKLITDALNSVEAAPSVEPALPAGFMEWLASDAAVDVRGSRAAAKFASWTLEAIKDALFTHASQHDAANAARAGRYENGNYTCPVRAAGDKAYILWQAAQRSTKWQRRVPFKYDTSLGRGGSKVHRGTMVTLEVDGKEITVDASDRKAWKRLEAAIVV